MAIRETLMPFPVFKQPDRWAEVRKLQKTSQQQTGEIVLAADALNVLRGLKQVQLDRGAGLKPRQRVIVEALKVTDWNGLRKLATDQAGRVGRNANPH